MSWRDETRRYHRWQNFKEDARMYMLIAGLLISKAVGFGVLLGIVAVVATGFYRLFI